MKAGRELDNLIAEKIMGWKPLYYSQYDKKVVVVWVDSDGKEWYFGNIDDPDREWSPSTKIEDAWLVLEKMEEEWAWSMSMYNEARQVDVSIGRSVHTNESVPLAICNAALKQTEKIHSEENGD